MLISSDSHVVEPGDLWTTRLPVEYRDRYDRPKRVRYWLMEPAADSPDAKADNEVDEVRWLPLADAGATLSYEHDRDLLRSVFPTR